MPRYSNCAAKENLRKELEALEKIAQKAGKSHKDKAVSLSAFVANLTVVTAEGVVLADFFLQKKINDVFGITVYDLILKELPKNKKIWTSLSRLGVLRTVLETLESVDRLRFIKNLGLKTVNQILSEGSSGVRGRFSDMLASLDEKDVKPFMDWLWKETNFFENKVSLQSMLRLLESRYIKKVEYTVDEKWTFVAGYLGPDSTNELSAVYLTKERALSALKEDGDLAGKWSKLSDDYKQALRIKNILSDFNRKASDEPNPTKFLSHYNELVKKTKTGWPGGSEPQPLPPGSHNPVTREPVRLQAKL